MSLRNVEKAAKRLQNVEDAIRRVRDYIHSYQPPGPGSIGNLKASVANSEMSTRYTVIDPVLRSLGWDLSDPSQCVVEKIAGQKRGRDPYPRVDYALLGRDGMVAALVEAKRISVSVRADPLDTSTQSTVKSEG